MRYFNLKLSIGDRAVPIVELNDIWLNKQGIGWNSSIESESNSWSGILRNYEEDLMDDIPWIINNFLPIGKNPPPYTISYVISNRILEIFNLVVSTKFITYPVTLINGDLDSEYSIIQFYRDDYQRFVNLGETEFTGWEIFDGIPLNNDIIIFENWKQIKTMTPSEGRVGFSKVVLKEPLDIIYSPYHHNILVVSESLKNDLLEIKQLGLSFEEILFSIELQD